MKKITVILIISGLFLFFNQQAFAQNPCCTPDTTVVDSTGNGRIEPDSLPNATQGQYYEQTITVIPMEQYYYQGYPVDVNKIVVDSITNLPNGMQWCKDTSEFIVTDPYTHYCLKVSGTPTEHGTFDLKAYITGTADFMGGIEQQVDTILPFKVNQQTGVDVFADNKNKPSVYPNPFKSSTKVSLNAEKSSGAVLKIYNILGECIYKEKKQVNPGKNIFRFNGNRLPSGTYICKLIYNGQKRTSKLIKTE